LKAAAAIFLYAVVVIVAGALIAPWIFWALPATGSSWLADQPFRRVFNRSVMIAALAGLWPLLRAVGHRSWADLGYARTARWRSQLLTGLALGVGSFLLAGIASLALGARHFDLTRAEGHLASSLVKYALTGILVGVVEETFFRGGLQGALQRSLPLPGALAITSAVYAALHFLKPKGLVIEAGDVRWDSGFDCVASVLTNSIATPGVGVAFVTLALAGMILGWAFAKTRALYLSIGLHAGWVFTLKTYSLLTDGRGADANRWLGGGQLTENVLTWPVLMAVFGVTVWLCRGKLALLLVALAASSASASDYEYRSRSLSPLPSPRHRHVALDLGGGRVGLFAGFGLGDALVVDVPAQRVVPLPCRQHFGDLHGIELAGGRGLLVDGRNDCVYDPSRQEYVKTANTFTGRGVRWPGMLRLPDGKIFLCGGFDDEFKPVADCAVFDLSTRTFSPLGKLIVARASHTITLLESGKVLVAGGTGARYTEESYDTLELFDVRSGESLLLPARLQEPRQRHAAAKLHDGSVLFVGGYNPRASESSLASAEVFDPSTEKLEPVGSLGIGRGEPVAALLPSGRVAVFGGRDDVRVVEIFLPEQRAFVPAQQLMISARRSGFTVTALDTGELLVVGGRINSGPEVLAASESFTETRSVEPTPRDVDAELAKLVRQLGGAIAREREAATRALIAKGQNAIQAVQPLLNDPDPELRYRAEEVLRGIGVGSAEKKWCVELWNQGQRLDTLWFAQQSDGVRMKQLAAWVHENTNGSLVVRLPTSMPVAEQTRWFDLVGKTRAAVVRLGEALPATRGE